MTDLFGNQSTWRLEFSPSELAVVLRPVHGKVMGGHQMLLQTIQEAMSGASVELDGTTLNRVANYAENGVGGFQVRFRVIRTAAWRAGWVQSN